MEAEGIFLLTEEELTNRNRLQELEIENLNGHIEGLMQTLEDRQPYYAQEFYKSNDRNKSLVHENDELLAEVERLKFALTNISQVDTSNWYDDANYMKNIAIAALEESSHE